MAGYQHHVIGDLQFKLHFLSEPAALAQQGDIIDFIKTDLLPLADSVLDEFARNGQTIRYDELKIDLGQVSYNSMRPEIAERFRNQLRSVLANSLKTTQPTDTSMEGPVSTSRAETTAAKTMSRTESELQTVQHFLTSGLLPWQTRLSGSAQFDTLFMSVIKTSAADLIRFLQTGPAIALDRMVAQVPEPVIMSLVAALVPDDRNKLTKLKRLLDKWSRAKVPVANARRRIWSAGLRHLLSLSTPILNIAEVDAALRAKLVAEGVDVPAAGFQVPDPMRDAMREPVEPDLKPATVKPDVSDPDGSRTDSSTATDGVEWVEALLTDSRFIELAEHWTELIGPRRQKFETALVRTLVRRRVRRRLVSVLSDAQRAEVVRIFSPDAAGWIERMVTELQKIWVDTSARRVSSDKTTAKLWDYSIAWLVINHDCHFDKLSWMESQLRQIAAYESRNYITVLESFGSVCAQRPEQQDLREESTELFGALMLRESSAGDQAGSKQREQLTLAIGKIDILRDFAAGLPPSLTRPELKELLRQLSADQPAYLYRLLQELHINLDPRNEAITADTILGELKLAATAQRNAASAGPGRYEQHSRQRSAGGQHEIGHARSTESAPDDIDDADSLHRALDAEDITTGKSQQDNVSPSEAEVSTTDASRQDNVSPLEAEDFTTGKSRRDDVSPEESVTFDSADGELAADTAPTVDTGLLHAFTVLRQILQRWPEQVRSLLRSGRELRRAAAGDDVRLRSAVDAFLFRLSAGNLPAATGLEALIRQLSVDSGKSVGFWRNELIAFARRCDDTQYPKTESFAALRLQSLILPTADAQRARHYATVMNRFDELVRPTEARPDRSATDALRALLESERDTRYLVNSMSEQSLAKAIAQLFPRDHAEIRYLTEVISAAAVFDRSYLTARALRRLIWHGLFDWLIGQGQPFAQATLARHLTGRLLDVIRIEDSDEFVSRLGVRLPTAARQQDWLSNLIDDPVVSAAQDPAQEPSVPDDSGENGDESMFSDNIFVYNAGVVLLAPYLPRLFETLNLTSDNAFVDDAAAERAALLLQFVVTDNTDAPEYELALNKLLCGIPLGRPLTRQFEVSDAERETVNSMLNAVIEHWGAIGHTSVEGLRSTFLQREGRLLRVDSGWQLLVEGRTFDLLLDRVPWNYKLIKYAWMDEVLHVDWR